MTADCHKFIEDMCRQHKKIQHQDHKPKYFRWHWMFVESGKPPIAVIGDPTRMTIQHTDVELRATPMIDFMILKTTKINKFQENLAAYSETEQIMGDFVAYIESAQQGNIEGLECEELIRQMDLSKLVAEEVGPTDDHYIGWRIIIPFTNSITLKHDPEQWL